MDRKIKILMIGASGILGREFLKNFDKDIVCEAPSHKQLDITKPKTFDIIHDIEPHIIINCAGYTNVALAEEQKSLCWDTNVAGLQNLSHYIRHSRLDLYKFVHFSTDYIFDGTKGNYVEDDTPNPTTYYGLTKVVGESIIRSTLDRYLIIRTSFKPRGHWKYESAFHDLYTSAEFVNTLAPEFLKAIFHPRALKTFHIAGKPKTVLELARSVSPAVRSISRMNVSPVGKLPQNVTLNCSKWLQFKDKYKIN